MEQLNERGFYRIPSELIEDKLSPILGDWLEMYGNGTLTWEQFDERMTGIWWFLSKNDAIHSVLAWNNAVAKIKKGYDAGLLFDICKDIAKRRIESLVQENS